MTPLRTKDQRFAALIIVIFSLGAVVTVLVTGNWQPVLIYFVGAVSLLCVWRAAWWLTNWINRGEDE